MNAHAKVSELPQQDRPISEEYRLVAKRWVDADAAARLREELKTTTLEQQKQDLILREGDMPDSHAERRVKAGKDWEEYIRQMVEARTDANRLKAQLEYVKMKFAEHQDFNASARAEMRLGR
jgi:hypothetical protein